MNAPKASGNIDRDLEDLFRSGDYTICRSSIKSFVKNWVERAIEKTSGMYNDIEYLAGQSKSEFMEENGFK